MYLWNFDRKKLVDLPDNPIRFPWLEMLVEFKDTMPIARKEGPRFENHDLLEKSHVDSYLQRCSGSIITLWVLKWTNDLSIMMNVSATGKEGSSMQLYLAVTAQRRFGNDYAVDNTQVFGTFRLNPTNEYHLPQRELFGGLNFSSLQRFLTSGSCESTSFFFARSNLFDGCFLFVSTTYLTKMSTFGG